MERRDRDREETDRDEGEAAAHLSECVELLQIVELQIRTLTIGVQVHQGKDQIDRHESRAVEHEQSRELIALDDRLAVRVRPDVREHADYEREEKLQRIDIEHDQEEED